MKQRTYTDGLLRAARLARNEYKACRRRVGIVQTNSCKAMWAQCAFTCLIVAGIIEREAKLQQKQKPARRIAAAVRVAPPLPVTWGKVR